MNSKPDELERLDERSWAEEWERLPQQDVTYERSTEPAQLTIRLSSGAIQALKRIALAKRLQYGPLARSWIAEASQGVHSPSAEVSESDEWALSDEQLNLKLDAGLLNRLKLVANELRVPYHRLARLWIYERIVQEQSSNSPSSHYSPSLKEILLVLLHAKGPGGRDNESIRGVTRLIKLLFVASQRSGQAPAELFYAYNYGPFNDEVYDLARALESEGALAGEAPPLDAKPGFEDMMRVLNSKGRGQTQVPVYQLTDQGSRAALEIIDQRPYGRDLLRLVESIKKQYGALPDDELIERVYAEFPQFTDKSLIADEVRKRSRDRHRKK